MKSDPKEKGKKKGARGGGGVGRTNEFDNW
jgi:hypothetical protein